MKNYWFIGDIHGEICLLDRLIENVMRFQPDQIVFVGDYIDRGSHAKEVVDRLMGLQVPTTFLMGNHEMMMLDAVEDPGYGHSPVELWYYNGGEATLQSFGSTSFFSFQSTMDPVYLEFFRKLKMSHVIKVDHRTKVLGTHAGISPAIPLEDHMGMNDYKSLNRYLLKNHIDPNDSFLWVRDSFFNSSSSLWDGYLVVHGHTPTLKLKRFISSNGQRNFLFVGNDICIRRADETGKIVSIGIDSGSVISGRLTGLGFFVEEDIHAESSVRMRSITVSEEDIFPRDLGTL